MSNKKDWKWIEGEYSVKGESQWYPYITSLCNGEDIESAKKRIQNDNPRLMFRNLRIA